MLSNLGMYALRVWTRPIPYSSTQKMCCVKHEGEIDHSTLTRLFKKFCLSCWNLDDLAWLDRLKITDSEAVLSIRETDPMSSTWRVSGDLCISHSTMVYHFDDLDKSIWSCQTVLHLAKILQKLWLTLVHSFCFGNFLLVFNLHFYLRKKFVFKVKIIIHKVFLILY